MSETQRVLFLHLGTRKSGTSFLQEALLASADALRAQGLGIPLGSRFEHFTQVFKPLSSVPDAGPVPAPARKAMARLADRLRESSEPRLLLTLEDLAQLTPRQVAVLLEALTDFDVHVVITARHWAKQIPSEWQQCVKERLKVGYPDYARSIRERDGSLDSEVFLARQHVPEIAARWGSSLPPGQVHVLPVPSYSADPGRLPELFCGILGVDPASLTAPGGLRNRSLGYEQAETLRRVNVALGDRLADFRKEYRYAVRKFIARGSLLRQKGSSLVLPTELVPWCHEESAAQAKELLDRGYDIVGDIDDLVSEDRVPHQEFREVTDAELAQVAVTALADLAVLRHREIRAAEKAAATVPPVAPPAPAPSLLRRAVRRLRS
ncbi:MAG TPA: hypothetical protein VFG63_13360 [Nocardioidaceae bacterium]|nr:hypothetical protein [Nocardioidaceae bacterium]